MFYIFYKWKKYSFFHKIEKFLRYNKKGESKILYAEVNKEFAYDIIGELRSKHSNSSEENHYNYQKLRDLNNMRGRRSKYAYLEVELEPLIYNLKNEEKRCRMKSIFLRDERDAEIINMNILDAINNAIHTIVPTCEKVVVILITPYKGRYPEWKLKEFGILRREEMILCVSNCESFIKEGKSK